MLGCALSASMAAGQATRPAGADTNHAAPSATTGPAPTGQLQQPVPQRKASDGSTVEAQPIRRDTPATGPASGTGGAARRDGSGKPVAPPPASGFDVRRVALALGAVVGLIFLLHWVTRRLFPSVAAARALGAVRVIGRAVISPKQQILLIQVGRRVLVVGDCGTQMNALAQLDDADEIAALLGQLQAEKHPAAQAFHGFFGKAQAPYSGEPSGDQKKMVDDNAPDEHVDQPASSSPPPDLGLSDVRGELVGLMDRVKQLSQQFRKS